MFGEVSHWYSDMCVAAIVLNTFSRESNGLILILSFVISMAFRTGQCRKSGVWTYACMSWYVPSTWLPLGDIFATTMSLIFIHSNGKHGVWIRLIYIGGTKEWTKTIQLCYLSVWIEIVVCTNKMALNTAGPMIDDCFIVCMFYVLWVRNLVLVPKNDWARVLQCVRQYT